MGLASAYQTVNALMRLVFLLRFTTYLVPEMPLQLVLFMDIYTAGIGTNRLAWATPAAQLLSRDMAARILWDMKRKYWNSSNRAEASKICSRAECRRLNRETVLKRSRSE